MRSESFDGDELCELRAKWLSRSSGRPGVGCDTGGGGKLAWFSRDSVGVVKSESSEAYESGSCELEIE